jgi:hypothetical protein
MFQAAQRGGLALAILFAVLAGEAQAQVFVTPTCQGFVSGSSGLRFDSPEQARWYTRFWTGECDHLLTCIPGKPNWNEVAVKIIARGGVAERSSLQPRVCRLGERIGLEWSREHRVRHVSTSDLERYHRMLEQSSDALRGVVSVEKAVDADMRRPAGR